MGQGLRPPLKTCEFAYLTHMLGDFCSQQRGDGMPGGFGHTVPGAEG